MGCDVHMWVEARAHEEAPWQVVRPKFQCDWCRGRGHYKGRPDEECYRCKGAGETDRFEQRNYTVFAMLGDVRNEYGVAGPPWRAEIHKLTGGPFGHDTDSDAIPYIAKERGFPRDLSEELRTWLGAWEAYRARDYEGEEPKGNLEGPGNHDDGWVTLREVLDYVAKDYVRIERGFVPIEHWKGWPENFYTQGEDGQVSYCKGVGGGSTRVITPEEADVLVKASETLGEIQPGQFVYVRAAWKVAVNRQLGEVFLKHFVPACLQYGSPENVRLVFNFDS